MLFRASFAAAKEFHRLAQRWEPIELTAAPPWGKFAPRDRRSLAFFNEKGQGIALYSPASKGFWNVGAYGKEITDDPLADPCVHVAPW